MSHTAPAAATGTTAATTTATRTATTTSGVCFGNVDQQHG
jgi:hypothetical protein